MAVNSTDDDREQLLGECEQAVGHVFRDRELLERCLTHSSFARTRLESNERLEFLGDAILGLVVCQMLYAEFPDAAEGEMTRIKSVVVSRTTCARVSRRLGFERFLLVGKGLLAHRTVPMSILAAVFEALVAGIYLDGGLMAAERFIADCMQQEITTAYENTHSRNFKSLLQQYTQKEFGSTPVYQLLDEQGPEHSKCFKVSVLMGSDAYPAAWGPTKKVAEQRAAQNAWHQLQGEEIPFSAE